MRTTPIRADDGGNVNGDCMQLFLDEVAARHPQDRIVMVLDGAGWHQSQALTLAMELEHPRVRSIVAWPWIINSLPN